jgi:hypothetical protein
MATCPQISSLTRQAGRGAVQPRQSKNKGPGNIGRSVMKLFVRSLTETLEFPKRVDR